ncbi:primosomal protein N' (replication factor Y) - superfamily II helicase [Gemmobacter aquarius]|uniref:Primosomal protein N' (Replication factor Y)-superfamily II helicase n=1 Tax=Paragemmobacter aquarius TaxID=2169400 RepID=A0A2S0UIX5_9RHOB|nr:primosomal protein N' (replication factor Y) - superfamily II helicase [Gemmobacter aquarius]AWB47787.1 primosomal protein N' (replication factor Y) - superfamily II helicase [Gemmobacter aquarius]
MARQTWPCAECGAALRFVPGATELKCDHCGHVQPIPAQPQRRQKALGEIDLALGLADDLTPAQTVAVQSTPCPNCGALVEFKGAEHATECPFCATPVVTTTDEQRKIKPQAVLPFVLAEPQARDAMTKWLGSLWFAPNGLQEYARKGRALNGMYVPYWTFDAATRSRYRGARGDHYYTTETYVSDGKTRTRQVQHTRWTSTSGRVARDFDDVLVLASQSLPRDYTDNLAPWDLSALEPYNADYLAGFTAEGYTIPLADGHAIGRDVMAGVIGQDVRSDIGGDEQRIDDIDTDWSDETFKHVLLPIWMAAYKYGGKSYRFVVNGQTGKVQGERPWSKWKIAFAVLLALIAAGIFFAVSQNR